MEDTLLVIENVTTRSINLFKEVLLAINTKLDDTTDFLKYELEEKNLFIRTLLLRDANDELMYVFETTSSR